MGDQAHVLGFGVTLDPVAVDTACGQVLSLSSHRRGDEHPPHRHVNDYICVVLAGSFSEHQNDSWHERRTGSFFLHHAGETHNDHFGPKGAVCLSLHLEPGRPSSGVLDGNCTTRARLAADQLAFELAASNRDELYMAALAAELMGELGSTQDGKICSSSCVDQIVEAISDDPLRRWSLHELAAIAQRHPIRMAQAFRARTGLSIGAYQRRRRLLSLSLAIRRGKTPLAVLAADYGYYDQPHMNLEFRAAFGVSPGRYRKQFH